MNLIDIFGGDAFSSVSLTDTVNGQSFEPTFLRELGLFRASGITSTDVAIENTGDSLALVSASRRGGPPAQHETAKRTLRKISTLRLAAEDRIVADEIQNLLARGAEDLSGVEEVVNQRLGEMRSNLDFTEEHLMLGAIQGNVLDADGSTVLINLFDEFGVSQPASVNFALGTDSTNVKSKAHEVVRTIRQNAGAMGGAIRSVNALCGSDFFDSLISHPEVERAYEQQAMLREGQAFQSVDFGGIRFWDYQGTGNVSVADGEAHFFADAPGLFRIHYAPADTLDFANTVGRPRYALQAVDPRFGQHVDLHVQSNPLPLCTKPQTLIKGTAA